MDVPWSRLPLDAKECVLSFLPVPTLCRLRIVCKEWNKLLCSRRFHEIYEQKQNHEVLFLTRFNVRDFYTKMHSSTTCFLDLDERRWYTIKGPKHPGFDSRFVAMDEGLVAEFWYEDEETENFGSDMPTDFGSNMPTVSCVQMSDPISKRCWSLEPPFFECPEDDYLPMLVVADRASRTFRIFLVNNSGSCLPGTQLLWIYDSSKDEWQCASHPPDLKWEGVGKEPRTLYQNGDPICRSLVFFHEDLYAILSPYNSHVCFLMKYDCQKDTWSMIHEEFPEQSASPKLVVSSGRLFMTFWQSALSTSKSKRTHDAELLEMLEIEVPKNVLRTLFQIPSASLEDVLGESIREVACFIPLVGSDGSCSSVTLVSGSSGRVITYDVVTGSTNILPAHPWGEPDLRQMNLMGPFDISNFQSKGYSVSNVKLFARDILRARTPSRVPYYTEGRVTVKA